MMSAAEELRDALKKISRAQFEVLSSEKPPAHRAIIIGDLKNPEVQGRAAALKLSPGKVEQIAVYTIVTPALASGFTEIGWQIHLVASEERLRALDGRCDVYWFRHPHGPNKVPADYWEKHLAPAVRNGALAVFVSYWGIPLDQYFQNPSLKVKSVPCGKIPLAGRTTAFIAPGDWSSQPNNLLSGLKGHITPAYGFAPADADAWTVLATAANGSDKPYPYLLARRYGKGMIILGGDDIRLSPARMLENFVWYHDH